MSAKGSTSVDDAPVLSISYSQASSEEREIDNPVACSIHII